MGIIGWRCWPSNQLANKDSQDYVKVTGKNKHILKNMHRNDLAQSSESMSYFHQLPLESTKNNKYFHQSVDLSSYQGIVKQGKVDWLPKYADYSLYKNRFNSKLNKIRKKIDKYLILLEEHQKNQLEESGMVLEIIWGYDINTQKNWTPFVEISQKYETMPKGSVKDSVCSVILTDEYAHRSSVVGSSQSTKAALPLEQQEKDGVVFSTPLESIKDPSKPEWCICYRLAFDK